MNFLETYFSTVSEIASQLNLNIIEEMVDILTRLRHNNGRLFFIGVGGSAANCSHAVNDFRKLCGIETYTPVDNVSELTARTNDEGWHSIFSSWLITSKATANDVLFVLSVGGGDVDNSISPNLVEAIDEAKTRNMQVLGIVGRDGGYTKKMGDCVLVIPTVNASYITPHAEAFQAVVWHALVSHPKLQIKQAKWEGYIVLPLESCK